MIDLHIHSSYSDGEYDVQTLVKKIKDAGIDVFSITDHDDFSSAEEVFEIAGNDMKFISGVELSSVFEKRYNMHILGYGFDINNKDLNNVVLDLKNKRIKRIFNICNYLKEEFGIVIPNQEEIANSKTSVGKPAIAHAMVEMGVVNNAQEAFKKYLKSFKSADAKVDAELSIKLIKKAKGISVLAHPKELIEDYNLDYKGVDDIVSRLKKKGLMGMECYYSTYTEDEVKAFLEIANKYKLLVSIGSDFHGEKTKPHIRLGEIGKNVNIKQITVLK